MNFLERVQGWFRATESRPTLRKIADMLPVTSVHDDLFPNRVSGERFEPGSSYFGLRLSGLHLVDARQFATERLPLCVCLAEFDLGGVRRTVPFSIGPDVIRNKLDEAGLSGDLGKSTWIELRDITVLRPTPVSGANLSIYAGLFSVPGGDLVKTLLNVVGTVGTALANPAVGPALKVSESIYDSFGALLGFNQVDQVVAALIGTALNEQGSGYLLIGNVDPVKFPLDGARVLRGRLHWPADQNGGNPVREFDHVILAIERFDTVTEKGTGLAESLFGQSWSAVRSANSREAAEAALGKLRDTISASPDLTEDDRLKLLVAYGTAAVKLSDARWHAQGSTSRGVSAATLQTELSRVSQKLEERSNSIGGNEESKAVDATVAARLSIVADQIGNFPGLPAPNPDDEEKTYKTDMDSILDFAYQIDLPKLGANNAIAQKAAVARVNGILAAQE